MTQISKVISGFVVVIFAFCCVEDWGANAVTVGAGGLVDNSHRKVSSVTGNLTTFGNDDDDDAVHSISSIMRDKDSSGNRIVQNKHDSPTTKQDYLSQLPSDIQLKIAYDLMGMDDNGFLNLRETSKYWRNHLNENGFSKYSIIGTNEFMDDDNLCEQLANKPNENFYKHVRFMAITKRLWDKCDFINNKELVNLEELLIDTHTQMNNAENFGDTSNNDYSDMMWNHWNEIQSKIGQYPKLTVLETINARDEGILHVLLLSEKFINQDRLSKVEYVLKTNLVNVSLYNSEKFTPLHFCFIPGLLGLNKDEYFDATECVRLLIKYGADVNAFTHLNLVPIDYAAAFTNKEPLQVLLENGSNKDLQVEPSTENFKQVKSNTPICTALNSLIAIQSQFYFRWPEFFQISMGLTRRHLPIIPESKFNRLERPNANLDLRNEHPFYHLLNNGADLNKQCRTSGSVLAIALSESRPDLAREIIESEHFSPDLANIPDRHGETSMMIALRMFEDIFDLLIEKGVNISNVNKDGETILHQLLKRQISVNVEQLQKVLDIGVDINSVDHHQNSVYNLQEPYIQFSFKNQSSRIEESFFETVSFLLQKGYHLHHLNEEGQSNLIRPLYLILINMESIRQNRIPKHLLHSILEKIQFDQIFANLKGDEEDDEYILHMLDAHLIFLTAYKSRDKEIIQKARSKLPSFILNHFEKPYVNKNGLVYSHSFLEKYKKKIFSDITRSSKYFWAFSLLQRYSPSVTKYIDRIELSYDIFRKYHLSRAVYTTSIVLKDDLFFYRNLRIKDLKKILKKCKNLKEFKYIVVDGNTIITYALLQDLKSPQKKYLDMIPNDFFRFMGAEIGDQGYGLFHYCIIESQENADWCISKLLARGMNPNINGSRNITPLHLAIKKNSLEDTSRLLEIEGINKNAQIAVMPDEVNHKMLPIDMGASLLHLPAYLEDKTRRLEFTRLLLQHDVPTNVVDAYGKTPLRYAVLNEDMEVIKLILEKDPQALFNIGFDGQTALMDAVRTNNIDILELLLDHAKTHLLVDKEDNESKLEQFMNQKNSFGMTVHDYAVCIPSRNQRIKSLLGAEQLSCKSHAFNRLALAILQIREVSILRKLVPSVDGVEPLALWNYISLSIFHRAEHSFYPLVQMVLPEDKYGTVLEEAMRQISGKITVDTEASQNITLQKSKHQNKRLNRFFKCFGLNCLTTP